jgi:hypothetical protein
MKEGSIGDKKHIGKVRIVKYFHHQGVVVVEHEVVKYGIIRIRIN